MLKVGDIVGRKSYDLDIYFRVSSIENNNARLRGLSYRIEADAPIGDLEKVSLDLVDRNERLVTKEADRIINNVLNNRKRMLFRQSKSMQRPGKVLHIDGDSRYLDICMKYYNDLEIDGAGIAIKESEQASKIQSLINKHSPDIVIITGHDSIKKDTKDYGDINNYRNSKAFVETVIEARKLEPNLDDLVIIAGACQSYYEAIINAGANYASSPKRILIHALDPVLIAERIAYASISNVIGIEYAIKNTITGINGIGGLQTRGKFRIGAPFGIYKV